MGMATRKVSKYSAADYAAAQGVIRGLRKHKDKLTRQEIETLRGQALGGDVEGAERGLREILKRRGYVM